MSGQLSLIDEVKLLVMGELAQAKKERDATLVWLKVGAGSDRDSAKAVINARWHASLFKIAEKLELPGLEFFK